MERRATGKRAWAGSAGLLAAALLAACAGPKPLVFNPKYRDAKLDGRTLHVLPIPDVDVQNSDDFYDDLKAYGAGSSPNPEPALLRLFARSLNRYVDHANLAIDSTWSLTAANLQDTLLPVPGEQGASEGNFAYPPAKVFQDKGVEPDLVLQILHLACKRNNGQRTPGVWVPTTVSTPAGPVAGGGMMMGGGNTMNSLDLEGRYLIWDYRAMEPVAYGRFEASSSFMFAMTRDNWENAVEDAVQTMVRNSPFKGAKLNNYSRGAAGNSGSY